ncbi:hypothetical protein OAI40_00785 [Candidatus Pseudothioglobus singularis]|nr:hypothetical protein [Candidatus Pseudothioglobus singularis]
MQSIILSLFKMGMMDKRINTIRKSKIWFFSIALLLSVIGINTSANEVRNSTKRVPAEWENQEIKFLFKESKKVIGQTFDNNLSDKCYRLYESLVSKSFRT